MDIRLLAEQGAFLGGFLPSKPKDDGLPIHQHVEVALSQAGLPCTAASVLLKGSCSPGAEPPPVLPTASAKVGTILSAAPAWTDPFRKGGPLLAVLLSVQACSSSFLFWLFHLRQKQDPPLHCGRGHFLGEPHPSVFSSPRDPLPVPGPASPPLETHRLRRDWQAVG